MAETRRLCPSAQPATPGAMAIGVVDHAREEPEVAYLDEPVPVTDELLAMTGDVKPTQVFRFAAPCQTSACAHWDSARCTLVERIVQLVPAAALLTPTCRIRANCRWFTQRGRGACLRCPGVVTQDEWPTDTMRLAAAPQPKDV